jgi:hypothetical protein
VKGRQHDVHIFHTLTGQPDFVEAALRTFFQIHTSNSTGDVLIFLPGQEEIENLSSSIRFYARQLPQGVMSVNNVREPPFHLLTTRLGLCVPHVFLPPPIAAIEDLYAHTTRFQEMYPCDQHRRNLNYNSWHQVRDRHRKVQGKALCR